MRVPLGLQVLLFLLSVRDRAAQKMITEAVSVLFVLFLIVETCLFYWKTGTNVLPGPIPLPLIGNIHNLGSNPHLKLTELAKKYGKVFQIFLGSQRVIVVNKIEAAKEALLKKAVYFAGRPMNHSGAIFSHNGYGINFGDFSATLRFLRKEAHEAIKMYSIGMDNIEEVIYRELDEISQTFEVKRDQPFDPHPDIALVVSNLLCAIVLGSRYEVNNPEFQQIIKLNDIFGECMGAGNLSDVFPWLKFFPSQNIRRLKQAVKERDRIFARKYKEHLETFDEENIRDFTDGLLRAIRAGKGQGLISERHIVQAMSDIFVAGSETTSTAIRWAILHVIRNPEVQDKIQEELDTAVGDRLPMLSDKKRLCYLEAVVAESLRFSSAAALSVPHKVTEDTTLQSYPIPKGTVIMFNLWAIHHAPSAWRDPYKFDPGRFLNVEENMFRTFSTSYLPFSAGKRHCLGEHVAKTLMFLFLARLLHRFRIENPPGREIPCLDARFGLVLAPHPYDICVHKRY